MKKTLILCLLLIAAMAGCAGSTGNIVYEKEMEENFMVKEVHAEHILVKTEEEAKQILGQLKTGANFEKIAQEKSLCPSGKKGGDLGWFGRGRMVREFELAAFSTPKGMVSQPFKTQFGWHIVKVLETR